MSRTQGRGERGHDAIVIGAGLAGLTAAGRLAEAGARVLVLAKGVGATHLYPGTIDVLGYGSERVDGPAAELPGFLAEHPGHPYGLVGVEGITAAVEWFRGCFADEQLPGYAYRGDLAENMLLPTPVGVPKPSALAPESMGAGDVRRGYHVAIVSFRTLKDFHPTYLADDLERAEVGPGIRARGISLDLRPEDRAEVNALALARAFDDPVFRAAVAGALVGALDGVDRVGSPPHWASPIPRRRGRTWSAAWTGRCSRSPPCRRRCPASGSTACCARGWGGRVGGSSATRPSSGSSATGTG